jgi:hypothetical protein
MAAIEQIVAGGRPIVGLTLMMSSLIIGWYVYVPIHELLHALGCLATGGTVTTLEIQVQYGGALLAQVFPFVVPGGEYAGRLSDFDTHGSDLTYLATDALPYALSILGVLLLRACTRKPRPVLFGLAAVLGLAPFYNLPGDYYEMGSIVTTAVATAVGAGDFTSLRADDLILLVSRLFSEPVPLIAGPRAAAFAIVATSTLVGTALAFATWGAGAAIATRLVGHSGPATPASALQPDDSDDRRDRSQNQQHHQPGVDDADPE